MKLPIVIIGPMCAGKSTVAKLISKKLSLPHYPVDYLRGYYYLKNGIDIDTHEALREGDDFKKYVSYVRPFEIDAVEKIVNETEFKRGIIHFGAGHSYYDDKELLDRAKKALENIDNVILLMPSADINESISILADRLREREESDSVNKKKLESMLEVNEMFIKSKSNFELAKTIVYTKDKNFEEIADEIISKLQ
jgi:shikimate kinase